MLSQLFGPARKKCIIYDHFLMLEHHINSHFLQLSASIHTSPDNRADTDKSFAQADFVTTEVDVPYTRHCMISVPLNNQDQ